MKFWHGIVHILAIVLQVTNVGLAATGHLAPGVAGPIAAGIGAAVAVMHAVDPKDVTIIGAGDSTTTTTTTKSQ